VSGMIGRRQFVATLAGAAAWPLTANAQQTSRISIVGFLSPNSAEVAAPWTAAFVKRLRELGWTEKQNIQIEYRWQDGRVDRTAESIDELVALKSAVIVTHGVANILAAKQASAIPVVFALASDPVLSGFVESLSRPGGNMTGFTNYDPATGAKWLEVLRELVPGLEHVGLLLNSRIAANVALVSGVERAAAGKLTTERLHGLEPAEIDRAFEALAGRRNAILVVLPNPTNVVNQRRIIDLAAKHRVPAIYPFSHMARNGGLIAYGIDQLEQYRAAARYVDRILRGAKPGDLPVQQPDTYELAINLRAAKELGLDPSAALRARANELVD